MNWTRLKRITAPATAIISLAEAQDHLRVDGDEAAITRAIEAATATIDGPNGIGIALITQDWQFSLDSAACTVQIPLNPVQCVTSVTVRSEAGDWSTLDAGLYTVDLGGNPAVVRFKTALPCGPDAVRINFRAGFGDDPADVPADLRAAALLIIGHLYENREATVAGSMSELPRGVASILNRYGVVSFG